MHNTTQKRFALVCAFSFSSLIFWSDITASASSVAAAAVAASSSAPAASPVLLHERIAAATTTKEKLAIIKTAKNDEVEFSLIPLSKEFAAKRIAEFKAACQAGDVSDDEKRVAQVHNKYLANDMRLGQEGEVLEGQESSLPHDSPPRMRSDIKAGLCLVRRSAEGIVIS